MDQIDLLRNMTESQRLEQAFQLSDLVRELAIGGIKKDFPHLTQKEVISVLVKRLTKKI